MRSFEHPTPTSAEVIYPANINLLTVNSVSSLREAQEEFIIDRRHEAMSSVDGIDEKRVAAKEAEQKAINDLDSFTRDFMLGQIEEDDSKFDEYFTVLRSFSADAMTDEEFFVGKKNDDGNFEPNTEGTEALRIYRNSQLAELGLPTEDEDDDDITEPVPVDTAEYDTAINNLNVARDALAKAEVQFRTRKWFNGPKSRTELKRLRDLYEEASYNASLAHFTKLKEEQDDVLEIEALRAEAAIFFANEFKAYTDAQNNTEYFTKHGKKARALGEASLGKKLKKAILPLGITALGALTGGTGALIGFGIATGMRLKSNIDGGTIGHRTKNQSEALIQKKTKKTKESIDSIIGTLNTDEIGEAARIIASGHKQTAENIHKSNVNRRRFTGAVIGAGALLGAVKIAQNYDNVQSMWHSIKNFSPFDENKIIEKDKYPDVVFKDYAKPWEVRPSVTTNLGDTDSSILGSVHDSLQPRLPQVPEGVTSEMLRNLDHLLHANGSTPYAKALDFYGGDSKGASAWLQMAIDKTPGARWVGSSQGGMISINGRTDTGYVWDTLTKSMLK